MSKIMSISMFLVIFLSSIALAQDEQEGTELRMGACFELDVPYSTAQEVYSVSDGGEVVVHITVPKNKDGEDQKDMVTLCLGFLSQEGQKDEEENIALFLEYLGPALALIFSEHFLMEEDKVFKAMVIWIGQNASGYRLSGEYKPSTDQLKLSLRNQGQTEQGVEPLSCE